MMNEIGDIIVSGHICADLLPDMDHTPASALARPGRLYEVGPLTIAVGGTVSNTGLALHRLGVRVNMMAVVGDDVPGQFIVAALNEIDPMLTRTIRVRPGGHSSYSVVLSPAATDRTFLHHIGTNSAFGAEDIDYASVGQAKIFHLGYPPLLPRLIADDGQELAHIFRRVDEAGTITSMDMAMPDPDGLSSRVNWHRILENSLPYVDLFIPSIDEAIFMLRRADYDRWGGDGLRHVTGLYLDDMAAELLGMGAGLVGFKLGEYGFYLRTASSERLQKLRRVNIQPEEWAQQRLWHPAFRVQVAGTTGAGDSSYAAFMAALLRGLPPMACLRWACAVGACCVEAPDSTTGIQTWAQTQQRLDAGWATLQHTLPES